MFWKKLSNTILVCLQTILTKQHKLNWQAINTDELDILADQNYQQLFIGDKKIKLPKLWTYSSNNEAIKSDVLGSLLREKLFSV